MTDPSGETDFPVIDLPAAADRPDAAVRHLVAELVRSGRLPDAAVIDIITRVWARERLGSTAVGRGLAVPHARSRLVGRPVAVVGRCPRPFNWPDGATGELVGVVCLVVVPDGTPDQLPDVLERVVRQLRGPPPVRP